jgi:hypothetical protein
MPLILPRQGMDSSAHVVHPSLGLHSCIPPGNHIKSIPFFRLTPPSVLMRTELLVVLNRSQPQCAPVWLASFTSVQHGAEFLATDGSIEMDNNAALKLFPLRCEHIILSQIEQTSLIQSRPAAYSAQITSCLQCGSATTTTRHALRHARLRQSRHRTDHFRSFTC